VTAPAVHPTAIVDPAATLGAGVTIGAFSVVGPDVVLGDGVAVGHHVVIEGRVEVGPRVSIGHFSSIGGLPQDLKFDPATVSGVRIGPDTVLREYVAVHRATRPGGVTEIGRRCLLMGLTHVAHDCRLGEGVVLVNYAGLSGHCELDDFVTVGGQAGLPPFTRVGTFAYVGGCSKLEADLPPYMLANGNPATVRGINNVGLRRAGMPAAERRAVKEAYRVLYRSGLAPGAALERLRRHPAPTPAVERIVTFVAASTRRGICPPPRGWRDSAGAGEADVESERVL